MVQVSDKLSLLHRSRIDIIANILYVSDGGAKKTHIMYKCNLSFRQLHAYLDLLINRGLLRKINQGGSRKELYETTSKGRRFIQAYKNIKTLLAI